MAKRFILSPVIGTGTDNDAYRAKALDQIGAQSGARVKCVIPSNTDGTPKRAWCLCAVSAPILTTVTGDVAIESLPAVGLDAPLGLNSSNRNALTTRLSNRGVTTTITAATTLRQLITAIGTALDPNFRLTGFDVPT